MTREVYKVVRGPDGDFVAKVAVKHGPPSAVRWILCRPFPFCFGVQFDPKAMGRVFFATAAEAVAYYRRQQVEYLASVERRVAEAREAIAWCDAQE